METLNGKVFCPLLLHRLNKTQTSLPSHFSLINRFTPLSLCYLVTILRAVFEAPAILPPTLSTLRKPIRQLSQYEDANYDSLHLCRSGNGNMAATCPVHLRLDVPLALTKRNI